MIYVVTGPRGCGKSTVARALARGLAGASGTVTLTAEQALRPFGLAPLRDAAAAVIELEEYCGVAATWALLKAVLGSDTLVLHQRGRTPDVCAMPIFVFTAQIVPFAVSDDCDFKIVRLS